MPHRLIDHAQPHWLQAGGFVFDPSQTLREARWTGWLLDICRWMGPDAGDGWRVALWPGRKRTVLGKN